MTITDSELSAIEARAMAATGGVWRAQLFVKDCDTKAYVASDNSDESDGAWITREICITHMPRYGGNEDAAFIAHCGGDNGDVLRLVAEVRRLRAELEACDNGDAPNLSNFDTDKWEEIGQVTLSVGTRVKGVVTSAEEVAERVRKELEKRG